MSPVEGLNFWDDGPYTSTGVSRAVSAAPDLPAEEVVAKQHLWVVRTQDVVHAPERSDFGSRLKSGVIKHTNLTGGESAFAGGELFIIDPQTVVITGCSGRYGPTTREEMQAVAKAFADSGYGVWSMGWDDEVDLPAPFIGAEPQWVD